MYGSLGQSFLALAEREVAPGPITVRPGEGWWTLAERLWGDGKLYPLLMAADEDRRVLRPGDVISVPKLEDALKDPWVVRPGESLWTLLMRLEPKSVGSASAVQRIRPRVADPNRIFPYQRVLR